MLSYLPPKIGAGRRYSAAPFETVSLLHATQDGKALATRA
jgi:hypothetical protein